MIKILFLGANPADTTRLRLDQEVRGIDRALRLADYRDAFSIEQQWAAQPTELQALLMEHRPDIVHFSGHGSEAGEILLEGPEGTARPVPRDALSMLFALLKDNIRVVVLNACYSKPQAEGIAEHIDCVIGLSGAMEDQAAIQMTTAFYQALAYGRDVQSAFDLGCNQIELAGLANADVPQLLARRVDPSQVVLVAEKGVSTRVIRWINVPRPPTHFVGRESMVSDLVARLRASGSAVAVHGLAGVGKSALAAVVANHPDVVSHFRDGVLWTSLGPAPDVTSALAIVGTGLGIDVTSASTAQERSRAVANAIGQQRLLLVIDDAWQLEAAELLRCGGPQCAHLLTSRDLALAASFAGSQNTVSLPPLADDPACLLLQALAPEAIAADPAAARQLAQAVGGLPLALALMGGFLAAPERSLFPELGSAALEELADPAHRLALATTRLGAQSATLQETIALSLAGLSQQTVDAFYALGAFASRPATFDLEAAKAVTQADAAVLATLVARALVDRADQGVLALHQVVGDLARLYAPEAALKRHLDYYLARVSEDPGNWRQIDRIYLQVVHAWQAISAQADPGQQELDLVLALRTYHRRRGLWRAQVAWAERGLDIARTLNERDQEISLQNTIGLAFADLGQQAYARAHYLEALRLARETQNRDEEATALNNLGSLAVAEGDMQAAAEPIQQALSLWLQIGEREGIQTAVANLAVLYDSLGDRDQALAGYSQALALARQAQDATGEAAILNNLGLLYQSRGEVPQALEALNRALALEQELGDQKSMSLTLNNLGKTYHGLGEWQEALRIFDEALAISTDIHYGQGQAQTLNNVGEVVRAMGQGDRALEVYRQALALAIEAGIRTEQGTILNNIGAVHLAQQNLVDAMDCFGQALALARQVQNKAGQSQALNNVGEVHRRRGDHGEAVACYEQALALFEQIGDKAGQGTALNNIGLVQYLEKDLDRARRFFEQALPLRREAGDRSGTAQTLNNLAFVRLEQGDVRAAVAMLGEAIQLQEAVGDRQSEAGTRLNLALVRSRALDERDAARELAAGSVAILRENGFDRDAYGQTLAQHEAVLTELSNPAQP